MAPKGWRGDGVSSAATGNLGGQAATVEPVDSGQPVESSGVTGSGGVAGWGRRASKGRSTRWVAPRRQRGDRVALVLKPGVGVAIYGWRYM
jgi:hypothetical protein